MINLPDTFVLLDTEYTTWEGARERDWSGPNEYREMVQIGFISVQNGLRELASFECLVKPVKNPILSDYFIELTHITQKEIDEKGITLSQALMLLTTAISDMPIFSWGRDGQYIHENCKLLGITCPIEFLQFTNVKPILAPVLSDMGIDPEAYSSGSFIKALGLKGLPAHQALNDMRNFLKFLHELRNRGLF